MTDFRTVVVDFPAEAGDRQSLQQALDELRGTVGMVTALAESLLFVDPGVTTVTAAGGGTALAGAGTVIDFVDARIDSVRAVVVGASSAANHTVRVLDGVTELCRVTLPTPAATFAVGGWTTVTPAPGSRTLSVSVYGDGAATQDLTRVVLQMRTVRAQA